MKNRETDQKCLKSGEIVCVRASAQRRNHRPRIGRRIPSLASENPANKNAASDDFSNFISLGPLATHQQVCIRQENFHGDFHLTTYYSSTYFVLIVLDGGISLGPLTPANPVFNLKT